MSSSAKTCDPEDVVCWLSRMPSYFAERVTAHWSSWSSRSRAERCFFSSSSCGGRLVEEEEEVVVRVVDVVVVVVDVVEPESGSVLGALLLGVLLLGVLLQSASTRPSGAVSPQSATPPPTSTATARMSAIGQSRRSDPPLPGGGGAKGPPGPVDGGV